MSQSDEVLDPAGVRFPWYTRLTMWALGCEVTYADQNAWWRRTCVACRRHPIAALRPQRCHMEPRA